MLKGLIVKSQTGVGQVAKHAVVPVLLPVLLKTGFDLPGKMEVGKCDSKERVL